MTLEQFNGFDREHAAKELFQCCGSRQWVSLMMNRFPFRSEQDLVTAATDTWYGQCHRQDWLESFTHHPRIGDKSSLEKKFAGKEQAGVATAPHTVIESLLQANKDYEEKFGFIFIVCATGKSADEMLRLLNNRLGNTATEELQIAMGEQHKITLIRFATLFEHANFQFLTMSQLTTHVLDTSLGRPGTAIAVQLQQPVQGNWQTFAQSVTDADGRITDLLPPGKLLVPGDYKLVFNTGAYFAANNIKGFYPTVEIQFTVIDDAHYHVPLLINPFGYSTYRGS